MKYLLIIIFTFSINLNSQDLQLRENYNSELTSIIGSLASSNLYLSFMSIDLLSKDIVKEEMTEKKKKRVLTSLNTINDQLENNLKQLYSIAESDKDAKLIFDLVKLVQQLKLDNENLIKFVGSQSKLDLDAFNKSHKMVWENLKKFYS